MSWAVLVHPQAVKELAKLPNQREGRNGQCIEEARSVGSDAIRELRPRAGRSPWRAFYRRIGDVFLVGSIGAEAQVDGRKFNKAVKAATERINEVEDES
jgi:hypothetical protein